MASILLLSALSFRYSTITAREEHTKSYQRLTIPDGAPVLFSVRCKQDTFPGWSTMKNHRLNLGRLSRLLIVGSVLSAHPCALFSQDVENRPPFTLRSQDDSAPNERTSSADDARVATLPDAPMPQDQEQAQDPLPPPADVPEIHLNQYPVLPPGLIRTPVSFPDKFCIYEHKTFGPPAVILPGFGAGFGMINPPSKYPKEWKDGAGAFGRNYGYRVADHTSRNTAQFVAGALLHEDPRYPRSTGANPLTRTVHALAFAVFDKTDSGRTTFAVSNFASATAGGFVGMGILPDGYNDVTHAEQHMASEFLQIGIGNVLTEFEPQWGPWAKKLRINNILPAWWAPKH